MQITCPRCDHDFDASPGIDGNCPKCSAAYLWGQNPDTGLEVDFQFPDTSPSDVGENTYQTENADTLTQCPSCGKELEIATWQNGTCPGCGSEYTWDSQPSLSWKGSRPLTCLNAPLGVGKPAQSRETGGGFFAEIAKLDEILEEANQKSPVQPDMWDGADKVNWLVENCPQEYAAIRNNHFDTADAHKIMQVAAEYGARRILDKVKQQIAKPESDQTAQFDQGTLYDASQTIPQVTQPGRPVEIVITPESLKEVVREIGGNIHEAGNRDKDFATHTGFIDLDLLREEIIKRVKLEFSAEITPTLVPEFVPMSFHDYQEQVHQHNKENPPSAGDIADWQEKTGCTCQLPDNKLIPNENCPVHGK